MSIKRLVAQVGMVIAFLIMWGAVDDFDKARSGLETFKALFWMVISVIAARAFWDDFKKDRWPF